MLRYPTFMEIYNLFQIIVEALGALVSPWFLSSGKFLVPLWLKVLVIVVDKDFLSWFDLPVRTDSNDWSESEIEGKRLKKQLVLVSSNAISFTNRLRLLSGSMHSKCPFYIDRLFELDTLIRFHQS